MDDMTLELTQWFATLLTAIGTAVTLWQARRVKKFRDEIVSDRKRSSLFELIQKSKIALKESTLIMTPVGEPIRGVNEQSIIDTIQILVDRVHEHSHREQMTVVVEIADTVERRIGEYRKEKSQAKRHQYADAIHKDLNSLIAVLSKKIEDII